MSDVLLLLGIGFALGIIVSEWAQIFIYRILFKPEDNRHNDRYFNANGSAACDGWRAALGVSPDETRISAVKQAYRKKARVYHPDRGGSNQSMAQVNDAYRKAKEELGFN